MAEKVVGLKIMIVGAQAVGKSCLINQFCHSMYTGKHYATVGIELDYKVIKFNGISYKLQFLDTSGQARFAAITENFMGGTDAFLVVYDVTRMETFNELDTWLSSIIAKAPGRPVVIIGNKMDMGDSRQVDRSEAEAKVKDLCSRKNVPGIPFYETSAKDFDSIDVVVKKLLALKNPASAPKASASADTRNHGGGNKTEKEKCIVS